MGGKGGDGECGRLDLTPRRMSSTQGAQISLFHTRIRSNSQGSTEVKTPRAIYTVAAIGCVNGNKTTTTDELEFEGFTSCSLRACVSTVPCLQRRRAALPGAHRRGNLLTQLELPHRLLVLRDGLERRRGPRLGILEEPRARLVDVQSPVDKVVARLLTHTTFHVKVRIPRSFFLVCFIVRQQ